jgi:hypothetical protein
MVSRSWSELLDRLYAGSWDSGIRRFRSPFVFRGMSAHNATLTTRLYRLAAGRDVRALELSLLRNFRKYADKQLTARDETIWHWLTIGQHHGLPTRLLDWTYSPLVALHFATGTAHPEAQDGVVWCVDFGRAHGELPLRLRRLLSREHSRTFTLDMLSHFKTLDAFDALARQPVLAFVEPPSVDVRILNQFALFSVMSSPSGQLDAWVRGHPRLVRKVIVPARLKGEIRDKLDQANINERTLFPDLDGLSRWLAAYYHGR